MENKRQISSNAILIFGIIIASVIIIISLLTVAYSRYVKKENSNATAQVAKMICEMEVKPSEGNDEIINPYCEITVKDYQENQITQTDLQYRIKVEAKDNRILPEHYWKDEDGNIIARSVDVKDGNGNITERTIEFPIQYFKNNVKETKKFTIVFLNTGEEEIIRYVDFKLIAEQTK